MLPGKLKIKKYLRIIFLINHSLLKILYDFNYFDLSKFIYISGGKNI